MFAVVDSPRQRAAEWYWKGDSGYSASLKTIALVVKESGYSLLWGIHQFDVFLVRNEIIDDGL